MDNPQGNTVSEVEASTAYTARPGPWHVHPGRTRYRIVTSDGWYVAQMVRNPDDARLIAALPDMLAELKMLYARHGYQSTADVIAKATGTTDTHRDTVNEQRAGREDS